MKIKLICTVWIAAMLSTATFAKQSEPSSTIIEIINSGQHKINGYKYLCMENQGNQYDLENKFNAFFESIGFTILTEDEEEELPESERIYVLYGTYFHKAVPDALNNTTLTLRNKDGKIIFSSTRESACFISVKNCVRKGSDKIIEEIRALNYSFDPSIVAKSTKNKNYDDGVNTESFDR
ncbi:MAG: hypothetical protein MJZ72_03330 [Bacteroidales bacterium]|nr:hypothetical protein [Bacteroidales bacterium]